MRQVNGLTLTFHLAGINNQNFIMRDEQTGSYWQQISGLAISGPMKGTQLKLVPSDELNFATWKSEQPDGAVLNDAAQYTSEYASPDWDQKMRSPTVLEFPEHNLKPRDLMLGIRAFGASRAWLYQEVVSEKVVKDFVGSEPVLLVTGPDNESVRAFRNPENADFYRTDEGFLMDATTGSNWNFQGCAVSGKSKGACLEQIPVLRDYWFDWRNYNPRTTFYQPARSK
jgi:hypothetical protein